MTNQGLNRTTQLFQDCAGSLASLVGCFFSSQGTCFADVTIEGENFDGFYTLRAVGTTGFPVYVGYRQFRNFPELRRLFFWQGLRPSVIDATQASWAAITPFFPESYYAATRVSPFFAHVVSDRQTHLLRQVPALDTIYNHRSDRRLKLLRLRIPELGSSLKDSPHLQSLIRLNLNTCLCLLRVSCFPSRRLRL